ncbi:MAG: sensor histidine kinase [Bacillaceae bacterium]|nr:sensor histidine kinase [Bacillaceae bacterium]
MQVESFQEVVDHLSEGVVIMDENRTIHYLNQLADKMTRWQVGEKVPYCSYCQLREVAPGEERCLLVREETLPVFQAHMPTYKGLKESFQMSTSSIVLDGHKYIILILRNPKWSYEEQDQKVRHLLIQETMKAEESERKRIAMELHDHIGQSIYSVFLGLQTFKHSLRDEKYKNHLVNMENQIEQTLEDLKRLSKELHPSTLDHLGLARAINNAVQEWENMYQVTIETDILDIGKNLVPREVALHVYRVIQESVRNAVHHGKADIIRIVLDLKENRLYFQVFDNGIGFDVEEKRNTSLGLYHMLERMEIVGGELRCFSKKGGPTRLEGYVPLERSS